ncbi:MAG: hypothetical protein WBD31_22040, partial [Rubripirellula sp.]
MSNLYCDFVSRFNGRREKKAQTKTHRERSRRKLLDQLCEQLEDRDLLAVDVLDVTTFTPAENATTTIEIGGLTAGPGSTNPDNGHDQIRVAEGANLNGTLDISLINGFTPSIGDSFEVITYDTTSGEFDSITGADFAGGTLVPVIGPDSLTLVASELPSGGMSFAAATDQMASDLADFYRGISLNVTVSGAIEIDGQSISGTFALTKETVGGETRVTIGASNVSMNFSDADGAVFDLTNGSGAFLITADGVAAQIDVTIADHLDDVDLSGTFSLSINTTDSAVDETVTIGGTDISISASSGSYVRVVGDDATISALGQSLVGDFSIESRRDANGNRTIVGAIASATANLGSGFGTASATGITVSADRGGFLLSSDGITADITGSAALVGVDDLTLAGDLSARWNTTGAIVDEDITFGSSSFAIDFDSADDVANFAGSITIHASDFASLSGNFAVNRNSSQQRLTIAASGVSAFVGAGYGTADAVGFTLSGGTFGAFIDESDGGYAMAASGTAAVLGTPHIDVSGSLAIAINRTGDVVDETITTPGGDVELDFTTTSDVTSAIATVDMTVDDFFRVSGAFAISKDQSDLKLSDGTTVTTDRLMIGGSDLAAFAGTGNGTDVDRMGVELSDLGFGMLIAADAADASRSWTTLQGSGDGSLVGTDQVSLAGDDLTVAINRAASDGTRLDFSTGSVSINAGPGTTIDLDIDGTEGEWSAISGNLNLGIDDLFSASGDFAVVKNSDTVTLDDDSTVNVDWLTIGASNVDAFAGMNAGTNDALGLQLAGVQFALAMATERVAASGNRRRWTGFTAAADEVSIVGLDGLTLSGEDLGATANLSAADGTLIDFSEDAFDIATGNSSTMSIDTDADLGELFDFTGTMSLGLSDVANLSGDFTVASMGTGSDQMLLIGGDNLTAFLGVNGTGLQLVEGKIGVLIQEDGYAVTGNGTVNTVGLPVNATGTVAIVGNEIDAAVAQVITVDGETISISYTGLEEFSVDADNFDVVLDNYIGDLLMDLAAELGDIADDLLVTADEDGNVIYNSVLAETLPFVGVSIEEMFSVHKLMLIGDYIEHYLLPHRDPGFVPADDDDIPLGTYGPGGPTLQGLLDFLDQNWKETLPDAYKNGLDFTLGEKGFKLGFAARGEVDKTFQLKLDEAFVDLGLRLQGDASLDVTVAAAIDFDLEINWVDDVYSFNINELGGSVSGGTTDFFVGADLGPLGVTIGEDNGRRGEIQMDLGGSISLVNGEFEFTPSTTGVTAELPIFASLAGVDMTTDGVPVIRAQAILFGEDAGFSFETENFDKLFNFDDFNLAQVIQMFPNFRDLLDDAVTSSESLLSEIPFLDAALNEVLLFADVFDEHVYQKIDFDRARVDILTGTGGSMAEGVRTFVNADATFTGEMEEKYLSFIDADGKLVGTVFITEVTDEHTLELLKDAKQEFTNLDFVIHEKLEKIRTLQELVERVNASGVLPLDAQMTYDLETNTFTLPVSFSAAIDPIGSGIDFGFDLGEILALSTTAEAEINAMISGGLTLFVDIDGEVTEGTDGNVTEGSDQFESLLTDFDDEFIDQTIEIDNESYTIVSIVSEHVVQLDRVVESTVEDGDFRIESGVTMGIEDPNLNAELSVDVTDLAVNAKLGFLGATVGGAGTGSGIHIGATAGIVLDRDPDAVTEGDTRFSFTDLFNGEFFDAFQLSFEGDAFARLRGLSLDVGLGDDIPISQDAEIGIYVQDLLNWSDVEFVDQDLASPFDLAAAVTAGDIQDNSIVVVTPDLSSVLDVQNITFEDIIDGIQMGLDVLDNALDDQAFYTDQLPVINRSLEEIFSFTDDFLAKVEAAVKDPAETLQEVERLLEEALGITDDNNADFHDQMLSLRLNDGVLDLHVEMNAIFNEIFSFNLDLDSLLPGENTIGMLADLVNGGGNIELGAYASLTIDIGIDFSGDLPNVFLYDFDETAGTGTRVELGTKIRGENLELGFRAGPMEIGVKNGYAVLDGDGVMATDDYATFIVSLDQETGTPDDDGRFDFASESILDNLNWDLNGGFDVNLPLALDIAGLDLTLDTPLRVQTNPALGEDGLVNLLNMLRGEPHAASVIVFTYPDIAGTFESLGGDFSIVSMLNNPETILDGIDFALATVEDAFMDAIDHDLPLIGDKLVAAANFLGDMRTGVLSQLRETASGGGLVQVTREALFDVLGTKLGLLDDNNGDGQITIDDVGVAWYDAEGNYLMDWVLGGEFPDSNPDALQFDLTLGGMLYGDGIDIPLDLDLPGFSLNIDGGIALELGWSFDLGFGLSTLDGFYLTTNDDENDPEFEFEVKAFLDGSPTDPNSTTAFAGDGSLLFLKATIEDMDGDPNKAGFQASGVYGHLSIDYTGNERDRLTFNHIVAQPISKLFDINFGVDAHLQLDATLEIEGAGGLPKLRGEVVMDWGWDFENGASDPYVAIENLRIDVGSFVEDFLGPIARQIQQILEPFRPIIDVLLADIEPLRILGLENPNMLELINLILKIQGKQPVNWAFLYAAKDMLKLVDQVNDMLGMGGEILLGDIVGLGSAAVTAVEATEVPDFLKGTGVSLDGPEALTSALSDIAIKSEGGAEKPKKKQGFSTTPRSGFQVLPYIKDIGNWMNLLTGGDAVLFTYEMPLMEFNTDFSVLLAEARFYVLSAKLTAIGELGAAVDLAFGYDTYGIRKAIETGNGVHALDGFFVADVSLDKLGEKIYREDDKDEFTFRFLAGLEAAVGLTPLELGLTGAIEFYVGADLQDIQMPELTKDDDGNVTNVEYYGDGKIRGSEIATMWDYEGGGPANLFNITAGADFLTRLRISIAAGPITFDFFNAELFRTNLFEVEYNAPIVQPYLAEQVGDVLYVNVGDRAGLRQYFTTEDGDETLILSGSNGTVNIEFEDWYQTYNGVNRVVANMGRGDDTVDATRLHDTRIEIDGGTGDDVITAGTAGGILLGGTGDDRLTGSSVDDVLRGGNGEDRLTGGEGDDILEGGRGTDRIYGGLGRDTYYFADGYGTDRIADYGGDSVVDMSGVTTDLEGTVDSRKVEFYDGPDNRLKIMRSPVTEIIMGSGNDSVFITDFATHDLEFRDAGGDDYYQFTMGRASSSKATSTITVNDNNGTFDEVSLYQTRYRDALELGSWTIVNGREIVNYSAGVERVTVFGDGGLYNDGDISNFGGVVAVTGIGGSATADMKTTGLRLIGDSFNVST